MKKRNILYSWRFYTLDRHEYHECMEKLFPLNLTGIRHLNAMCSAMSLVFMIFPVLIEKNLYKAGFYLSVSFLTAGIAVLAGIKEREHKNDGKRLSRPFVYALMILGHANLIAFGIYIGVWTMPDTLAVNFMVFLVCSLFLFINPAAFNLILTLCSVAVFIIFTVTMKTSSLWTFDAVNALVAGVVNAAFTWLVVKFRILAAYNAGKLEEERNSYYDQSTVDELTQLKNRRDFMQTFQRYLTSYRDSDVYLCIAVADLDFFKNYNDYYGHPEGDECLRMVGKAFNGLRGAADI
ncbi:MAG: diguanylate cyclase, partial [Oscillospiraceae bacterium]|nr:diguanylate cyclase [Oscillospiraceae bacterium]